MGKQIALTEEEGVVEGDALAGDQIAAIYAHANTAYPALLRVNATCTHAQRDAVQIWAAELSWRGERFGIHRFMDMN